MYLLGIDFTFIVVILPFIVITFILHGILTHIYFTYTRKYPQCGLNGMQTARRILDSNGLKSVLIARAEGELSDRYDPNCKTIRLSYDVYSGRGITAIGVAAHEAGHAIQDSIDYTPYKIRQAVNHITDIGNKITIPVIIIGVALEFLFKFGIWIAYIGAIIYALSTILQLITLRAEFNASKRGRGCLEADDILLPDEMPAARTVMRCAAITNVVYLAITIINVILHAIGAFLSVAHHGGHELKLKRKYRRYNSIDYHGIFEDLDEFNVVVDFNDEDKD